MIVELNYDIIDQAIQLTKIIFKNDSEEIICKSLEGSLDIEKWKNYLKSVGYPFLKYWIAIDVYPIGIIGLYEYLHYQYEPGTIWVGWFGVLESYRGKGIGRRLLQFIVDKSRSMGYHRLKLYTENNDPAADHLYNQFGFKTIDVTELPHAPGIEYTIKELNYKKD